MEGTLTTFVLALSGGLVASIFKEAFDTIRSKLRNDKQAKEVVDAQLDPLLKAADELVGKTISLSQRDFVSLIQKPYGRGGEALGGEYVGLVYLYAQFWSRIEILRHESVGISISKDKRGEKLSKFIACIESHDLRLVDKTHQKAIGQVATSRGESGKLRPISLLEFESKLFSDEQTKAWVSPLIDLLNHLVERNVRQKILMYGLVAQILVDTLDNNHHATHERPSFPNKLSKESKRTLKYQVFKVYLPDGIPTDKYMG